MIDGVSKLSFTKCFDLRVFELGMPRLAATLVMVIVLDNLIISRSNRTTRMNRYRFEDVVEVDGEILEVVVVLELVLVLELDLD